jgi:hypothetical protein
MNNIENNNCSDNKNNSDEIPDEFYGIINDFVSDISNTFPEYIPIINKWWKTEKDFKHIINKEESIEKFEKSKLLSTKLVYNFCIKKYPQRYFDIIYENDNIFSNNTEENNTTDNIIDTEFLPRIYFKDLWANDISETNKATIWKYLQLILITITKNIENNNLFGDTSKLFEAISEDDLTKKLQETINNIHSTFNFKNNDNMSDDDDNNDAKANTSNEKTLPSAEELNEHISGLFSGKIGKLAQEITEEITSELNLDVNDITSSTEIFTKMLKRPGKLMDIMKNIGSKMESKFKSGELKESEILEEVTEAMDKMKNIPGMDNMQDIFKNMNIPGMDKNSKMNMNNFSKQMEKSMKNAKMKERMKSKAEANTIKKEKEELDKCLNNNDTKKNILSDEQLAEIFKNEDKPEKTPINKYPVNKKSIKTKKGKKNK